jgi:hypothetical protein
MDVGLVMGLEPETCRKYFDKGVQRGEFGAPNVKAITDTSIIGREPELAGDVLAKVVVATTADVDEHQFGALRQAMRDAGCPEKMIKSFLTRFRTTLATVASEGKRLTLKQLTEEIDRKIAMVLGFMDEQSMAGASFKDLSIGLSVLIEKQQLLQNKPTHIIDFNSRQQLTVLLPRMVNEAKRRGITLDGSAERVDAPVTPQ